MRRRTEYLIHLGEINAMESYDRTQSELQDENRTEATRNYPRHLAQAKTLGIPTEIHQSGGQLPPLTADQREQVLYVFNATQRSYPHDRLIHELFEDQVE